jgi:hypothetical protein
MTLTNPDNKTCFHFHTVIIQRYANPVYGKVYSVQHFFIKNVSDLRQVVDFLRFPPPQKTDRHDITNILLKVALNTMTQTLTELKAITFKNKHEVVLGCYLPLHKIDCMKQ